MDIAALLVLCPLTLIPAIGMLLEYLEIRAHEPMSPRLPRARVVRCASKT
jgi:hypothetical protein